MSSHPFRAAVESEDIDAAIALLAPDVTFRSPVVHKPFVRRHPQYRARPSGSSGHWPKKRKMLWQAPV